MEVNLKKIKAKELLSVSASIGVITLTSLVLYYQLIQKPLPPSEQTSQNPTQVVTSQSKSAQAVKPSSDPTSRQSGTQATVSQELPNLNGGNIFGLVNAYRISNGKPPWTVSDELCKLAEGRAEYVIQPTYDDFLKNTYSSFKSHPGFQDMAKAFNYSGLGLSENLAMGARSDSGVITLWKNSPTHNALMLAVDHNGTVYTKACVATRVKYYGSITVLLAGDK